MAGAVLLPAGPASATAGALVPSTFSTVNSGHFVSASTDPVDWFRQECPIGTEAVSAGAISAGLKGLTLLSGSFSALDTGAVFGVDSFVVVQATCAPSAQLAGSRILTNTGRNHTSNPIFSLTTTCPTGQIAIGGGGIVTLPNGNRVKGAITTLADTLTSDGRGWTVTIKDLNNDRHNPDHLIESVRCIPDSSPGEKRTVLKETVFPLVPPAWPRSRSGSGVRGVPRRNHADHRRRAHHREHTGEQPRA